MLFNDRASFLLVSRKRFSSFAVDYTLTLLILSSIFFFDPGAMKNLKEEKAGGGRWEVECLLLLAR